MITLALSRFGQKLRRAGGAVTQDENIGVECFEIARGVLERFAFGQAGSGRRDIDYVRAQPKRGEFERCAGARARLDEEIHQCLSAQRRHLLDLAGADFLERVGGFEDEIDFVRGKLAQAEQILSLSSAFRLRFRHAVSLTSQTASGFAIRFLEAATCTCSSGGGRQIFADVIGANGQFAMAAIDQGRELNPGGPAE